MSTATPITTPKPSSLPQVGFIPEIQGLRTVALLLVATFHVWFGRVSGGVDVFLLISAFLMTRSLTASSLTGLRPQPIATVVKKFARLLPLAATATVLTVVAARFLLPSRAWEIVNGDALASLFYVENFRLQALQVDYYAAEHTTASLFQHFWSLSIQGQVFIIWPLLHLLGFGLAKWLRLNLRGLLIAIFGAVFVTSFTWSIWFTQTNQTLAYFDTGARAWEFAAGSILALVSPFIRLRSPWREAVGWIGLVGVLSCGLLLPVESSFPGWAALWPVVSASLVILSAGERTKFGADRVLSSHFLAKSGDYTYALYLFHWPILILYLTLVGAPQAGIRGGTLVIAVAVVLSVVATELIERPISNFLARKRAKGKSSKPAATGSWRKLRRQSIVVGTALALAATSIGATEASRVALVDRERLAFESTDLSELGARADPDFIVANPLPGDALVNADYVGVSTTLCSDFLMERPEESCIEGIVNPDAPLLYTVGNSHSQQFAGMALETRERTDVPNIRTQAGAGCVFRWPAVDPANDTCDLLWTNALDYIEWAQPDAVLVVGTNSMLGSPEMIHWTLIDWIEEAKTLSPWTKFIVVRDTPRFAFAPLDCANEFGWDSSNCSVPYVADDLGTFIDDVERTGAIWVDINEHICPDNRCRPQVGGVVTYFDNNHVTGTYFRTMAQDFADIVAPHIFWWPEDAFGIDERR